MTPRLAASGAPLSEGRICACRQTDVPHVHRWQIQCPICLYPHACDAARTYELPEHELSNMVNVDDDDDPGIRRPMPARRTCNGSGFRITATLGVWELT